MKFTTSEVEVLQQEWAEAGKISNNDKGWGIEQDDSTGGKCDCFCIQCRMRHIGEDFFEK